MKVVSWNLLRLTGAAVEDVAALVERERPELLLMQEATEHIDALPALVGGHFHRLPWPGKIHGLAAWSRHTIASASDSAAFWRSSYWVDFSNSIRSS